MSDGAPVHRPNPRRGRAPIWVKLWSVVILANLAGFLVSLWVSRLVRAVPETAGGQTALLFAYYAAMAIIAFLDALLLDELLFHGAFRRTHLQGQAARAPRSDADVEDAAVSLQRSTLSFPFLLLVTGAITYLGFNFVNNDFDVYYRRVGKYVAAMHHGDDAQQIEAIAELSIRREPAVVPALRWRLAQGGDPARWAAWALGRFGDLPVRKPLVASLLAAAQQDDPALRHEALIALGRLQDRDVAPQLQAELASELEAGGTIDLRLMYALGAVQHLSSIPVLTDVLHRGDTDAQRMAAWALAQHRDQDPCNGRASGLLSPEDRALCEEPWALEGGLAAVRILEERLPTAAQEVRCAIVHSLGILAHERSNLALMRAYDETTPAERTTICPRLQLSLRPDGDPGDRVDLFMPQDTFAMKVIASMGQMRATDPAVRAAVEPWLEGIIADEHTTPAARESARSLLTGIRQGRDDTQARSVDEALGIDSPEK